MRKLLTSTQKFTDVILIGFFLIFHQQPLIGQFQTFKTNGGVQVSEVGKKVLFYQLETKSLNGKYGRAGYIHPLYDIDGNIFTQDFPEDHPYHHGIFWAWHQIIINNKKIADGWTYENLFFQPIKAKTINRAKYVVLKATLLWKSELKSHKKVPIIKELTTITIHKASEHYRIIDFNIHLKALVSQLKIGGSDDFKGYGGFCVRLKLPENVSFNSSGKNILPQETAVTANNWMNITGYDNNLLSKQGLVLMNHPLNPGEQHKWILRSASSMQNIPYPGKSPVNLTNKGLHLKYRIVVHDGLLNPDEIERLYLQSIN